MSTADYTQLASKPDVSSARIDNVRAVNMFGVPVDAATLEQALDQVHVAIANRQSLQIGVVNAAKIVNMRRHPALRADVLASDVVYADGMSIIWASQFLGDALPERVAGIDLMYGILSRGMQHGYRVYCLGAKPEVVSKVCDKFRADYAGISIVGCTDGYFDEHEEQEVARAIRDARPDVLFVAITSPKKERFMARWADYMAVPVVHGVGGSFDVVAGLVERAPESWQRLGLEWLYRLKQEPRRLFKRYLITNSLFAVLLLKEKLRRLRKQ